MDYEWDENKRDANIGRHGVDFALIRDFDWETALIAPDTRRDYGETRFIAVGAIGDQLHVCAFTDRQGRRRIISLRKANRREIRMYLGE